MKFSLAIIIAALAFASVSQGQSTGDVQLPVKSSTGPLTPVWITKTANRALGWDSSGVLGPIPLGSGGGSSDWPDITNKPTTLAGYGITDSITAALAASTYEPIITTGSLALSKLATDPLARANHTGTQLLATISDAGALAALNAVGSAQITDGSIVNADISASAAIADAKIASASTWNAKESALTFSAPLSRSVNTISLAASGITPGIYGTGQQVARYTIDTYGRITAVTAVTIQPPVNTITGLGTGVSTALSISIGSNGAPVVFNGDAGTPSAINLSNGTALPLSTGVSGDLPLANLAQSSAASKLLGRGDSGAGDYQEITLGSGLTMTGTTLSASGGIGGSTGSTDRAILIASGTSGASAQAALPTIDTSGNITIKGSAVPILELNDGTVSYYFYINSGIGRISNTSADILQLTTGNCRVVGNLESVNAKVTGYAYYTAITTPSPVTGAALIYSKTVSSVAEMFVLDEAGNETQISPHSRIAPDSMYDSSFDDVGWSANYYTGIIKFTHAQRLLAGRPDAIVYETFEEHISRLGDDADPKVKEGIRDWDADKVADAAKSQAEHQAWSERKMDWLAKPQNAGKAFTEPEPKIIIAKSMPQFIADQIAGKEAFLAARPSAGVAVSMTSMRLALIDAQLLQPVLNVLEAIPNPVEKLKAKTWWETAQNVTRNHPLVLSLASALGQAPEQVDALFQAAKLKDAAP